MTTRSNYATLVAASTWPRHGSSSAELDIFFVIRVLNNMAVRSSLDPVSYPRPGG